MRLAGRLSAVIEILGDFDARRVPLKTAIADWSRSNRYAGAKDRAWISGLCLDVLRRKESLAATMGGTDARGLAFGALRYLWTVPLSDVEEAAAEEPHGPGALTEHERTSLSAEDMATGEDYPAWLKPSIERVFGDSAQAEMAALSVRADVDLRINTLKSSPEKTLAALKSVKGEAIASLVNGARITAPDPSEKAPAVTVIPAFNKGWVEVQDAGSQIAAAAAGDINGAQVLDYCAGGGGKTLALAAMMENTGQLYAYDRDARRLKPLFHRAKRAGVRNLQVRSPAGDEGLDDLQSKMDVVFVDAPCTGIGTWRRHPDAKWRLTERQLATRMKEQDQVLQEAAVFVKPGGRMVWVTCSFLMEENEDRLGAFLKSHSDFQPSSIMDQITRAGQLSEQGLQNLEACKTGDNALRLTPHKLRADGFFIASLVKNEAG